MARGERLNSKLAMETKVSPGFGSFIACHHVCSVLAVLCAMSAAVLWYFGKLNIVKRKFEEVKVGT